MTPGTDLAKRVGLRGGSRPVSARGGDLPGQVRGDDTWRAHEICKRNLDEGLAARVNSFSCLYRLQPTLLLLRYCSPARWQGEGQW